MRRLFLRWVINTLGLFAAVAVVPGITYEGASWKMAVVAAVFGVVNAFLRPVLTVLTCPLIVLTLGFFILVVNGLLLLLAARVSGAFGATLAVRGLGSAVLGALIVSLVSVAISLLIGRSRERPQVLIR